MEWIELYAKFKVFEAAAGIIFIVAVLVGFGIAMVYYAWKERTK